MCLLVSGGPSILNSNGRQIYSINAKEPNLLIESFLIDFVNIVGRSPQCSRSMRLIHLIMDVLDINEFNVLKNRLRTRQQVTTWETPATERARLDYAVQWIQGVRPQFSLQNLTRRAVLCALSHRSLQDAATLGLPVHILQYVLLGVI